MKKIICLISFLLMMIYIPNVNALDECTSGEMKRLKELASNVEFKYEYDVIDNQMFADDEYIPKTAVYKITSYNLSGELKVRLVDDDRNIYFTNNKPTIDNFLNGEVVKVEISAYTKNLCAGKILRNVSIKLPYFNQYSLKEECIEYKEFKYCQEFGKYNISDSEFYSELENYKKNLEKGDNGNLGIDNINDINPYLIIGILVIFVVLGLVVFLIIKYTKKKESDL